MIDKKSKKSSLKSFKNVLVVFVIIFATVMLIWSFLGFFGIKESATPLDNFLRLLLPGCLFLGLGLYLVVDQNPLKNTKIFGIFVVVVSLAFIIPSIRTFSGQMTPSSPLSPDGVVQNYYNDYLTCQNDHAGQPEEMKQICPPDKLDHLTTALTEKLQHIRGYDPILCAQNIPTQITYDQASIHGGSATKKVHTHWGSSPTQTIEVGLTLEDNQWEISSVTCQQR